MLYPWTTPIPNPVHSSSYLSYPRLDVVAAVSVVDADVADVADVVHDGVADHGWYQDAGGAGPV